MTNLFHPFPVIPIETWPWHRRTEELVHSISRPLAGAARRGSRLGHAAVQLGTGQEHHGPN